MSKSVTNRTMILYHVTHKNNWFSVGVQGLLTDYARGRYQSIFLVSKSRIPYAIRHVSRLDGYDETELIVVSVRVRRSWLSRLTWPGAKLGLWRCRRSISPARIEWVETWPELTPAGNAPALAFREKSGSE